jgi:cell filamentation protein
MSKGSSEFCYPENIDREMRRLFDGLTAQKHLRGLDARKFAEKAAHLLAELNAIHPFREGNGRMQLAFLTVLAERAVHPLKLQHLDPTAMLAAMIASFQGDEAPLAGIIVGLAR